MQARYAVRDDGPALCELFASISMEADLHLSVERDPDFFKLYEIQRAEHRTIVLEDEGRLLGMGAILGRDAWIDGELGRVGYLGDLRVRRHVARRWLTTHFPRYFDEACRQFDCEVMLTAVIDSNRAARWALVSRHRRHPRMPVYRPVLHYDILNLHFTRLTARRRHKSYRVDQARPADLQAIAALLAADHRNRPFGYVIDTQWLADRIEHWPGLGIDSFYVARDGGDNIVGVAAAWDAFEVKRFRVLAYNGQMKWARLGFNLMAGLSRAPPLPPAGGLLRYFYLTHVSVLEENPEVMSALVDRIYNDYRGRGYHFMTVYSQRDDPLAPAYAPYAATRLPTTLYAVSRPGSRFNDIDIDVALDLGGARLGFEMALV